MTGAERRIADLERQVAGLSAEAGDLKAGMGPYLSERATWQALIEFGRQLERDAQAGGSLRSAPGPAPWRLRHLQLVGRVS